MSSFASLCGIHDDAREAASLHTARLIEASGVELVRFGWCDLHGVVRGKTLTAKAAVKGRKDMGEDLLADGRCRGAGADRGAGMHRRRQLVA